MVVEDSSKKVKLLLLCDLNLCRCEECGLVNFENEKKCERCGHDLESESLHDD